LVGYYKTNATDKEKKDNTVESIMDEEASSVSLFSWDERIYKAVEVGKAKNIIPTLKGIPLTSKRFRKKYPVTGRIMSLNPAAIRDGFRYSFRFANVRPLPMDSRARGKAAIEISPKVFSRKSGNDPTILE
jgi:hypothetical protein